jgi:serine/threonine protein kinase
MEQSNINCNNIIESKIKNIENDDQGRKKVNQYLFLSTIGKGSYAKVKLCLNTIDNNYYAVKIINKSILSKKKKGFGRDAEGNMTIIYMLDDAINEIKILKILNNNGGHKNVIKLYEIINDTNKIYLILEYCSGGSIVEYNDRAGIFSINKLFKESYDESILRNFIKDMAEGLEFSKFILNISSFTKNNS